MALVLGKVTMGGRNFVVGDRRVVVTDAQLDSSYPARGYVITPAALGLGSPLDYLMGLPTTTGHVFAYDYANAVLHVFVGGVEVAAGTDLSAVVARLVAQGKGSGF